MQVSLNLGYCRSVCSLDREKMDGNLSFRDLLQPHIVVARWDDILPLRRVDKDIGYSLTGPLHHINYPFIDMSLHLREQAFRWRQSKDSRDDVKLDSTGPIMLPSPGLTLTMPPSPGGAGQRLSQTLDGQCFSNTSGRPRLLLWIWRMAKFFIT